jgi:hypothetical protein
MRAVVEACSVMTDRMWSVVSVELARDRGFMATRDVEGSKLW